MDDAKVSEPTADKISKQADAGDNNLLDDSLSPDLYERNRRWYLPSSPMGISWFDKIFYINKFFNLPFYIHISLPIYIIGEIIWSFCHSSPLYWFALILLILIIQLICILFQILFTIWISNKLQCKIYRIIIWPYGSIGYACDYKQWIHFFIIEYTAPAIHGIIFLIFIGCAAITNVAHFSYISPMDKHFATNLLNGIWITNIIICCLHLSTPIYSMKSARLMVNFLYRKRTHREVAQIMLAPSAFMSLILMIYGIYDARPLVIFLSLWGIYQTYLLFEGNRRDLIAKLPLFQLLDDPLRTRRGRKKKSVDVGQKNRKAILGEFDQNIKQNTYNNKHINDQNYNEPIEIKQNYQNEKEKKQDDDDNIDDKDDDNKNTKDIDTKISPQQMTGKSVDTEYAIIDVNHDNDNQNDINNDNKNLGSDNFVDVTNDV